MIIPRAKQAAAIESSWWQSPGAKKDFPSAVNPGGMGRESLRGHPAFQARFYQNLALSSFVTQRRSTGTSAQKGWA